MSGLRNHLSSRPYYLADNQLSLLKERIGDLAVWLTPTYLLPCLLLMIFLLAILYRVGQKAQL